MERNKELISVIVPVYNVRNYLGKTIDCIIEQTYTNWELLLVDDGSTDGSVELSREYQNKDPRVKSIIRDVSLPKGAPVCRNIGLQMARGEFVIFLDSDDIIAPFCFRQRIEYIYTNSCDFAVFPMLGFYEKLFDADGMVFGYKPKGNVVDCLLRRTLPFVVVSNIYKREALIQNNIFWDTTLKSYQDSDYNLQSIKAGLVYKISNLVPDYYYRLSAQNSICKKLSTVNNCLSQIHFLEKQTKIYSNDKHYKKSLMICAAQIFQNILMTDDNNEITKRFISGKLFDGKVFLKYKISLVSKISLSINNLKILDAFQLLLMPIFFMRFKKCYFKWNKYNKSIYREASEIYESMVRDDDKKAINEKI